MKHDFSLSSAGRGSSGEEPLVSGRIVPSPLNTLDIDSIFGGDCDHCNSTVDVSCHLVTLAGANLQLVEGLKALTILSKNGVVPAPLVDVPGEDTPEG